MYIKIPLDIDQGAFVTDTNDRTAINRFVDMLMLTPQGAFVADPDFGFVFSNMKFEMFDEKLGVILNSTPSDTDQKELYEKKISGNAANFNTFARSLKEAIDKYEPRLDNVGVVMAYEREYKRIKVVVKGNVKATGAPYNYDTEIKIWR